MDLDDTTLPLGVLPIAVPRVTVQCGENGRRGTDPKDSCILRGGGKRSPLSQNWSTDGNGAYKNGMAGIIGGGKGSVAQVYVYGESAYEVTLRGLTFDNSLTRGEMDMYTEFVTKFGEEALNDDGFDGSGSGGEDVREELLENQSNGGTLDGSNVVMQDVPVTSSLSTWGGANQLNSHGEGNRTLQGINSSDKIQPAYRFASVAVLGDGYGDDAGPRIITIDDCRFEYHRGYAVLVSPGIQQPGVPTAPKFEFSGPPVNAYNNASNSEADSSGNNETGISGQSFTNINDDTGGRTPQNPYNGNGNRNLRQRRLNLLDNGEKFISQGGLISYYDNTASINYLDGRRVKIVNTEFVNNNAKDENVAGLVTSAYSLTLSGCFFQNNEAKAMVFVYNNEALVENTLFVENMVEVSTVVMASPKGSSKSSNDGRPTHLLERSCFLGSRVGMSNVLVTDVENTGFGQRDNHATGTEFTWVSDCQGGAAEKLGNDCLEKGLCDGTCVEFTAERCLAAKMSSSLGMSSGASIKSVWAFGRVVVVAVLLGITGSL